MLKRRLNFIETIIEEDIKNGFPKEKLRFRFPPEPNGYLHIGHVKSIFLNFDLGRKYNAPVNLRFDDTNPEAEKQDYIDQIKENILWLGYQWDRECYASDYFDTLYKWAHFLIEKGLAYVDSQSSEEIAKQKGTPTELGKNSPYRDRTVEENKQLFKAMYLGKFASGSHVLRAKISMGASNMLLRDPVMYRILYKEHHRTKDKWCIYPLYDWTHGQSDYIEQISHSLCSLEFKPHRELYNWFLKEVPREKEILPKQREFSRLDLSYSIISKRKLSVLVKNKIISGWDDPRLPTISGLKRKGYPPESLNLFVEKVGISRRKNRIDISLLDFSARAYLNKIAERIMVVLDPIKVTIVNYPDKKEEWLVAENNPERQDAGIRKIPFLREIFIERTDFMEEPEEKFFRLSLGSKVRLKNAYVITAHSIKKDADGNIEEIVATYDKDTRSGANLNKEKIKATIHWVTRKYSKKIQINNYDRLFSVEDPDSDNFLEVVNTNSLQVSAGYMEQERDDIVPGMFFQFQRIGYFSVDKDTTKKDTIFNKTVSLRDFKKREQ